jgi:hypothetical protein
VLLSNQTDANTTVRIAIVVIIIAIIFMIY